MSPGRRFHRFARVHTDSCDKITRTMRIYFDHNATTPVAPEVADAMATALRTTFEEMFRMATVD